MPCIRRPIVTSSAFSSLSGIGPGPGRAAVGAKAVIAAPSPAKPVTPLLSLRQAYGSCRACLRQVELWNGHGGDHALEDRVRGHLLGERLVREHEPVPERVRGERVDVLENDVVAAAQER